MVSDSVQKVLAALRSAGLAPRSSGNGWSCRCPAHQDSNPSLNIAVGHDDRALVFCFAGCSAASIVSAVGLTLRDLMPPKGSTGAVRTLLAPRHARAAEVFDHAHEAVGYLEQKHGPTAARWYYTDATGEPVGLVLRWDLPGTDVDPLPRKRVLPVSKIDGKWSNRAMPDPRPLYRLTEVRELGRGDHVYITEGEKAADAARALGLWATTSAGGSQAPHKTDWSPLAGLAVLVLPDNDKAGEQYGREVVALVQRAGASSVRVVRLPDLPESGDVVEFIAMRRARGSDNGQIVAEIESVAATCPVAAVEPATGPGDYTPFPVDALPEPLRSFVSEVSVSMGCDPSFVALPALVVATGCIGNACRVEPKLGWSEPAVLWAAPVGSSGSLKSPAARAALAPVKDIQSRWMVEHRTALRDYDARMESYEIELRDWRKSKEPKDRPLEPDAPHAHRILVSDITVEAIAPMLVTNPRGVICSRDELAGWLGSFDRYAAGGRGGDAPSWLSMYDADAVIVDRKGKSDQPIHVAHAAVSLLGTIQPGILRRRFTGEHRENGMLARILLACPPSAPALWSDKTLSSATGVKYRELIEGLLDIPLLSEEGGACQPKVIPLADDGLALFKTWHDDHARQSQDLSEDLAAAYSKLKGVCARLALVFHCIRTASEDPTLENRGRIDSVCVVAAIKISEWFKHEAKRVYAMLATPTPPTAADALSFVETIRRVGGAVTARELMRSSSILNRGTVEHAQRVLDDLIALGRGVWRDRPSGPKGGASTVEFVLDDGVDVDATEGRQGGSANVNSVNAPPRSPKGEAP